MDMDALFAAVIAGDAEAAKTSEMPADYKLDEAEIESREGNTKLVRVISKDFASKNLSGQLVGFEETALHSAVQHGQTNVVQQLIDAAKHYSPSSVDVDPVTAFIRQASGVTGNTALHLAVIGGHVDIVKLLVEADPSGRHVENNQGKTPIYIAAENGKKDIIKLICTTCAAQSLWGPERSTTVLHALTKNIRQEQDDIEVMMMMINTAKLWSDYEISFEALFYKTDESGKTVIELAVDENNVNAVELILGSDPAYKSGIKNHSLMRLIYKAINYQHSEDIVKALSQAFEDGINAEHKGVVDLILAIKRHHIEVVTLLLRGSKRLATYADDEGWTPLHYAVIHQFNSILGVLIEAQTDTESQHLYGDMVSTPFHLAVKCGYTDTMIHLMQIWPSSYDSAYIAVDEDSHNILHIAAAKDEKEMAGNIWKYCPTVYKDKILTGEDINGDTPLHLFISYGCFIPEVIEYTGLDHITVKNKKGWTPADMLYVEDDIIADQVLIKFQLDNIMITDRHLEFWFENKEKRDTWGVSVVPLSKRERKNLKFIEGKALLKQKRADNLRRDLENHRISSRERANTRVVVTALIITVAFTVGFTMPGGLHQSGEVDEGLVIFSRKKAFKAFVVSDAIALLMATSSLIFYFLEIINQDLYQVAKLSAVSTGLSIVSLMAMFLTFITGTYVVLSHSPALAITVCVISSLFFLLLIIIIFKIVYDHYHIKKNED